MYGYNLPSKKAAKPYRREERMGTGANHRPVVQDRQSAYEQDRQKRNQQAAMGMATKRY